MTNNKGEKEMTKYGITFMLENPYYEVEADDADEAHLLASKLYLADDYKFGEIMDMDLEIINEEDN
jgi:hypothetical protein